MATPTRSMRAATPQSVGLQPIALPRHPAQEELFNLAFGGVKAGLPGGLEHLGSLAAGDPSKFAALEAPALRQFQDVAGGLGARFSGLGTGAQRSSGFKHALGGAASDLAERLSGQRLGLQNQAIQQLMGMYGDIMGQDLYGLAPKRKKRSLLEQLLGGGLPIAGGLAGGLLGGPFGASLGGSLGGGLGKALLGDESNSWDFSNLGNFSTNWGQ